jgi:hypothetical protein
VFERLGITKGGLLEQFLPLVSVIKTAFYFRDEFVWNIKGKSTALHSSAQNITGMLLTLEACLAILADAPGTTKAKYPFA